MKAYEKHCDQNGQPGSHEKAKEILFVATVHKHPVNIANFRASAGFTGAFIDREAETRGMNEWDKEKAKRLGELSTCLSLSTGLLTWCSEATCRAGTCR